jgi:acetyl esterase/lipase
MAIDRSARRFLDLIRASAPDPSVGQSLDDMRRATEALAAFATAEQRRDVAARDVSLVGAAGDIPIRIYSPRSAAARLLPGLVYFHGGGWLSGGLDSHDGICRALADEGCCRVIAVAYRLAPEHRFPAALDDGRAAIAQIATEAARFKIDPRRIGIAGDSAGGNLAAVLSAASRETGPPLALQLLLCPVLDAIGRTASRRVLASGHFLEERTMIRYFERYRVDDLAADDARVSPVRAYDFHDLPPTRIHTAEYDPLKDEAALYAERLAGDGVDARLVVHPAMIHHFYGLGDLIPYAREALQRIGGDIKEVLS